MSERLTAGTRRAVDDVHDLALMGALADGDLNEFMPNRIQKVRSCGHR